MTQSRHRREYGINYMDSAKLNDWMQIIGIFAVVASLVFVGLQVRQDQAIARSQLFSDSILLFNELQQLVAEPEIARAYAKMINSPDDLSFEELVQLDTLLEMVASLYSRECYLVRIGTFVECENIVRTTAELYFGNPHAQSWWRLNGPRGVVPEWVDAKIKSVDPDYYRRRIEDTKAGMQ